LGDMLRTEDDSSVRGVEMRREPFIAEERLIGELDALREMAEIADAPAVAYFDGSLILWSLEHSRPPQRRVEIVKRLLGVFDTCRERGIVPAGYISFPGSRDIVNDLALLACDRLPANCDTCRRERKNPGDRPCTPYALLTDGELLPGVLSAGERSATFENRDSKINDDYVKLGGPDNLIRYFYLRNDYEVARVEFPAWATDMKGALDTLHAITLDQCDKGNGYPRALALAHEYALVSGAESRSFRDIIEAKALPRLPSPKELAKRRRKI
ncbi:MAG: DNA double-strand break repair nuclease NurA, partial [bacterium]|nr:DNA double-strand break repair nuclease NurA [bacterium]